MEIKVVREKESDEWTSGKLYLNGKFECFTLEDQKQKVKVMHETRIPAGRYEILLRKFGGHHDHYSVRFPQLHKGMLWLQDVPGFRDILIHIGNTDDDSSGCLLVGKTFTDGKLGTSTIAYKELYAKVIPAFEKGEKVFITIENKING
jgi:hypothetical protein